MAYTNLGNKQANAEVPRKCTAVLTVECRNLKGPYLGAEMNVKCAVFVGEYEQHSLGRRKNFRWDFIGETELVEKSSNPDFDRTIEIAYDVATSRLLRFDLVSVAPANTAGLSVWPEDFHIGAYVCDVQDLLKAPSWDVKGTLLKKGNNTLDTSHLQFEMMRHIRLSMTPAKVMDIFKSVDVDKSQCLNRIEFKNAIHLMAKQGEFAVSKEGEELAWKLGDEDKNGSVNYAEFVGIVFGTQGNISVMIEDRVNCSIDKHTDMLFTKYKRDLRKRMGQDAAGTWLHATSSLTSDVSLTPKCPKFSVRMGARRQSALARSCRAPRSAWCEVAARPLDRTIDLRSSIGAPLLHTPPRE